MLSFLTSCGEELYLAAMTLLRELFLANNLITHIVPQSDVIHGLQNLAKFTLNDTKLTNISSTTRNFIQLLPKLRHLTLSGNPWLCECDRQPAKLKSWMVFSMAGRIADIGTIPCFLVKRNIECINYFAEQLQFYKELARNTWISGGVLMTFGLVLLILVRFDKHIKVFLVYACPRLRSFRNDLATLYDVLLVYDHHDDNVSTRKWL